MIFGIVLPVWASEPQAVSVQSRVFDIEYTVNDAALPLDSVQLWYTLDEGRAWHQYGFDEDRQSPFTFHAPSEGLFGFYLVLTNAAGSSSATPAQGTQAHQWAFVDYTPPVVQLHALRQTTMLAQRVLQVRWTAIDANLAARPIELTFKRPPGKTWYPITSDPVANTGRYDWRVPEDVTGPVAVRVTVRDKGGHLAHSDEQVIETVAVAQPGARRKAYTLAGSSNGVVDSSMTPVAYPEVRARAARLFADALAHRDAGDYRRGIMRLREAVRIEPQMTEAFAEMADMLYRLGDYDRALNAYEIALTQKPTMREALRGAARVYRHKHDYASAAERLRTILRYNPNDAEVWMNLGDIAVYQGDDILARECYRRATTIDPNATEVVAAGQKRLELMWEVSRTYQPRGK
ncbi:MAG: tetratricopeptide repeat protein [Phycisphaerales bacterium]|nr:MAG: tetratricopeptide repeat protein [Phycisphaerales bacterium]